MKYVTLTWRNSKHLKIMLAPQSSLPQGHLLPELQIEFTSSTHCIAHKTKFLVRLFESTNRNLARPLFICTPSAVSLEPSVQSTYLHNFVAMTNERSVKQPSKTNCNRARLAYGKQTSLPRAGIRVMMLATTINHRFTPAIREHLCKPMRIQHSPIICSIVGNTLGWHVCNQIQSSATFSNEAATPLLSAIERYS